MQAPLFSFTGKIWNGKTMIRWKHYDTAEEFMKAYQEKKTRKEQLLKKVRENPRPLTPEIEAEVDKKVKQRIGAERYLGYCHDYWTHKKDILLVEYGIEWKSPQDIAVENGELCFFD